MRSELKKSAFISLFLVVLLLGITGLVKAQEESSGPVYIVQEGDTLWDIAQRFGVDLEALMRVNELTDPGQLLPGAELMIPGLEGLQGTLVTETVTFGDTLRSLSRRYQVPIDLLAHLNHLVSPAELFSGANLIVPQGNAATTATGRATLSAGQSLLELAIIHDTDPWSLVATNELSGTWQAVPGDVLHSFQEQVSDGPGALPENITAVELLPAQLVQGGTTVIRVETVGSAEITGSLLGHELHFFEEREGSYVALQGIHAMSSPGLYPLALQGRLQDGTPFALSQMVSLQAGDFHYETLQVPVETIDPAITKPEDEIWNALTTTASSEKMWDGTLQVPVVSATPETCFSSLYGNRRSYNGSPYNYFHTGLDFCYNYNLDINEIRAPAAGVVVFTGELTVRGNATMIDHGWGVYTGYMHQSEIQVKAGDRIEAGQVIGVAGETGRVSGPHLHLEVWVGGVQVDPMEWLQRAFP